MAGTMPPPTSTLQALPIRTEPSKIVECSVLEESEFDGRRLLVDYSSSPPPLIEDDSGMLGEDASPAPMEKAEVQTLRNEIERSANEYAALEERYSSLLGKHHELRKLASAYDDVIRGSSRCDEDAVSIAQLRADAGPEGLRAKALEADLLRPLLREAGGAQAFIARNQTLQSLVNEAGSLRELQKEVDDIRMVRQRWDEMGGLQGLSHLISDVHRLRSEQHEHAELRASVEGPDGLRSKALRYHLLQQAFAAVQRSSADRPEQTGHVLPLTEPARAMASGAAIQSSNSTPEGGPIVNPARAALLSGGPSGRDPNSDLYDPPLPPAKPSQKTGSNDIPLGPKRRRGGGASSEQGLVRDDHKRLKYDDEPQTSMAPARRRKVDIGRASAMVQANLQGKPSTTWNDANVGRPAWVGGGGSWQVRFDTLLGNPSNSSTTVSASSDGRLLRETSSDSIHPERLPGIKREVHDSM